MKQWEKPILNSLSIGNTEIGGCINLMGVAMTGTFMCTSCFKTQTLDEEEPFNCCGDNTNLICWSES